MAAATATATGSCCSGIDSEDFNRICAAIQSGSSVLALGETGMIGDLPRQIAQRFESELMVAQATYKGSGKKFCVSLAEQLDIPTAEPKYDKEGELVGEKALTMDALKDEILQNISPETLLVLPEAKRLTTGIRYWLEDLIAAGVRVVCFAAVNPGRDIFLDMIEIELSLPSDRHIREVMEREASKQGLEVSQSRLAELQPLAGRNPMLARKVIRHEKIGLKQAQPEHTQYVVIMPILIAALMSFGVVRFIGLGTHNKSLYILGGTALVAGMAMKQVGQVRGARKRLGQ